MVLTKKNAALAAALSMAVGSVALASSTPDSALSQALTNAAESAPELVVLIVLVIVFMRDRAQMQQAMIQQGQVLMGQVTELQNNSLRQAREIADQQAVVMERHTDALGRLHGKINELGIHIENLRDRQ